MTPTELKEGDLVQTTVDIEETVLPEEEQLERVIVPKGTSFYWSDWTMHQWVLGQHVFIEPYEVEFV